MLFWFSLSFIILFITFILYKFIIEDEWTQIFVMVTGIISAISMFITPLILRTDYNLFIKNFELQRIYFEKMQPTKSNDYLYTIDIMELNNQLIQYQTSKSYWKFASTIPDEVFDIEPIGIK